MIIMSIVTFFTYLIDKRKAIKGKWRIPEATLLIMSLLGGGIGGYISMFVCHHKTRKWYFHFVNIVGIAVIITAIVLISIYC